MIKIIIELWPFGNEQKKEVIAEAIIRNNGTGSWYSGNYTTVLRSKGRVWKQGETKGFPRKKQNIWRLLKKILNDII